MEIASTWVIARLTLLALLATDGCQTAPKAEALSPRIAAVDPAAAIVGAFGKHRIVLLGDIHRSAELHAFVRTLVASPLFAAVVDDVVLEAVNVRYQNVLDRFVTGDSVPRDSLRLAWRNSTQLLLWDSPLYEELVETIRDANRRSTGRKLRVLASDPPIDWNAVRAPADFPRSYGFRDWQTTEVVEREVLGKGRRALVLIGTAHIGRTGPRVDSAPVAPERESVGEALARKHPGVAWVVHTVAGKAVPDLEAKLRAIAPPGTIVPVVGSALERENSSALFGRSITLFRTVNGQRVPVTISADQMPPLRAVIDAILYLGPYSHEVYPDAAFYLAEPAYLAEVRRRIGILSQVYGGDFWTDDLGSVLRRR